MHVGALVFELVELVLRIFELVLEDFDFVLERSDGFVEGFGQWVGGGLHGGGHWSVGHICRCTHWGASGGRVVPLIAGSGWSVGLQSILRIEAAGVLGVLEGGTLVVVGDVGWVVGEGSGRHWEISVVFGGTIAGETSQPRHGKKKKEIGRVRLKKVAFSFLCLIEASHEAGGGWGKVVVIEMAGERGSS